MMKVHICPSCGYYAITSRRNACECNDCHTPMLKASVPIEHWWSYSESERSTYIKRFLEKQKELPPLHL